MPKYTYKCDECEYLFEAVHSIKEKYVDCPECEVTESLTRIPSTFFSEVRAQESEDRTKPGERVSTYIEEVRKEVKDEKQRLSGRKHK